MKNIFSGKSLLVTGGTGSIGSEIVRKALSYEPKVVRALSNDEDGLYNMEQELAEYSNVRYLLGDVRDKERLKMATQGIDIIFHAAALKHVPRCEYNPFEAVKTNIQGTQNLIDIAIERGVEQFVNISTDKAVNPINVLGATKLLAERLTTSANYYKGHARTIFSSVRFGNVLNSRGSVLPLFVEQISGGGPLTITNPEMARFVMSISKAVSLVFKATEMAQGGEIFIFKMPVLRLGDLAKVMIDELAPEFGHDPKQVQVEIIGKRPGEKEREELMTQEEATHAYETEDMFVVLPEIQEKAQTIDRTSVKEYISKDQPLLTTEQIKAILTEVLY